MKTRLRILIGSALLVSSSALPQTLHQRYDFTRYWNEGRWTGETLQAPGRPMVPVFRARILLPYGETLQSVRFQPMAATRGLSQHYPLAPLPRPVCSGEWRAPSKWSEKLPERFPESNLGDTLVVTKHGYRILYVTLFPVEYAPASDDSFVIPGGELDVETRSAGSAVLYRGLNRDRAEVALLLDANRDNQRAMDSYPRQRAAATLDYLVIAPQQIIADSEPDSLNRLLFEKNTRGVRTAVISVESIQSQFQGADIQAKIRNAIIQYYKNQGIQYVLLVGNGYSVTPSKKLEVKLDDGTDGILSSDFYFACLDGDFSGTQQDLACEVAVGRAPVSNTTEMHAFVAKSILMEELSDDDPRLKKELNFGEMLDEQTLGSQSLEQLLTGGTAGTLATQGYPASTMVQKLYETFDHQFSSSDIVDAINNGQFYTINHLGHANEAYCMRFYNTAISQLTNDLPFFAITQGCHPGNISGPNWASQLVVSPRGGAGAIIANSNYGFYSRGSADGPSNRFHLAFYDSIFRDGLHNLGKIHFRAKEKLIPQVQADMTMRWVVYETNLLGDPELELKLSP